MAQLNPVSNTNVLLESMLQKLHLNTRNNGLQDDVQTSSPSVEFNAGTEERSSESTVYQFGCSSNNSNEQDKRSSIWNNHESLWSHQSSSFGGTSTPTSNQPFKKIRKHVFSSKPKRAPFLWRERNNFTPERDNDVIYWAGKDGVPRLEKYQQFTLEEENKDVLDSGVPLYHCKTVPYQRPPDLLAQTLTTSSSVLEKPEVRGQSGTWSWSVGKDNGKTTRTSTKKWGEAKRWARKVKEQWKERHRGTEKELRDDGEREMMNEEVQSNLSPISGPTDVNNTSTELVKGSDIHNESIDAGLDEAAASSLTYMRTSNLMEEIFSGTQWAHFLSVTSSTQGQSNALPSSNNQSDDGEWTGKRNNTDRRDSHLGVTQGHPAVFTHDTAFKEPVYSHNDTSLITVPSSHVKELTTYLSQTSEIYSQPQVFDLSHNQSQDFIPLLDRSYLKPVNGSSTNTQGSLRRKREHWTKRRDTFYNTGSYMEDEDRSSSYMSAHSSNSTRSISPASSLNSLHDSDNSESSVSMETAVKKRRMEDCRHVRFAEEVIFLPPSIWPDEEVEEEEEKQEEKEEDWQEDPAPRSSFPKWIGSLKGFKSRKYKF